MKKRHFHSIRIIVIFLFTLIGAKSAFPLNEGGCLTCHRYPGMVRLDGEERVRVLHIDEGQYAKSSHGKFRCKSCHVDTAKVPHTGQRTVDCTTECHQGSDAKVLPENFPLNGFHRSEQSYITRIEDRTSCRVCHPIYPHSENNLVRAFLNMHNGFLSCEVCHLKRERFPDLTYQWKEPDNVVFEGESYGSYFKPKAAVKKGSDKLISRIGAFAVVGGAGKHVDHAEDLEKARNFLKGQNKTDRNGMKQELKYFHRNINRKKISVACNECHSENGILDFNSLGFDEKKAKDLTYINIKGLVTKYKTFYLPNLFGK